PTADGPALTDAARLARQYKERGLERIFRVLFMPQHAPADREHHRPVATNQFGERRFIAIRRESVEQLPIGATARFVIENASSTAEGGLQRSCGHIESFQLEQASGPPISPIIIEARAACITAEIFARS